MRQAKRKPLPQLSRLLKTAGPRCRTYAMGCIACEAWRVYDLTKRDYGFDEINRIVISRTPDDYDSPEITWEQVHKLDVELT